MSTEMAEKKKAEIDALAQEEITVLTEVKDDRCPACGTPTANLLYLNPQLIKVFGVVECTTCGCWYAPASIRKQKLVLSKAGLAPASDILTP